MSSKHIKVRYNEATSVSLSLGRRVQLTFPRIPGGYLDLSSLRFSCDLARVAGDESMDTFSYSSFFRRIVVKSANYVIMDVDHYGEVATILEHIDTKNTHTKIDRVNRGHFLNAAESTAIAATYPRRVSFPFLEGTFLNCSALIPVDKLMGQLTVELFLENPARILNSSGPSANANFNLGDIMINCSYLTSASLDGYFASSPLSFHVDDHSFRYQVVNQPRSQLRWPSANTSLNKITCLIRDDNVANPGVPNNTANKMIAPISWTDLQQLQVYQNQQPWWSEPVLGTRLETELYDEVKKAEPKITDSLYYTDYGDAALARTQSQIPLFLCFSSAPRFSEELDSGVATSRHTTDAYMDLQYQGTPAGLANLSALSWLNCSGRIHLGPTGSLELDR